MLQARSVRTEAGGVTLLDGVTFTVADGDKVGIVGRNGAGKTTLLKVLAGAEPASGGEVLVKGGLGYLPQDPRMDSVPPETPALSHVLSGRGFDEAARRLENLRLRMEDDPSDRNIGRYTRSEERFRIDGGYAAESDVRRLAAGLGVTEGRLDLAVGMLSGGERRRVELARILYAGSDVLLLDEPTNHLDADAKDWLLGFMRAYSGALIVISHDLDLLDSEITRVLHLDRGGHEDTGDMVEYRGTYSQYLAARERDEIRQAKLAAAQAAEIGRLQGVVDRFGAKASKATMAKSLEKRIGRIQAERVTGPTHQRTAHISFPDPPPANRTVFEVTDLAKSYDDNAVFDHLSFDAGRGDRVLILGLNGAGKTSLLKILAGRTEPDAGTVSFGDRIIAGYYAQEHEGIEPGRSLLDHMVDASPGGSDEVRRGLLAMFGLTGDKVFQDAGTLSGGEKTKLALAQLVAGRHNLLLLDEPTNNLDPASREAMAEALGSWPGTVVLVSHDTEFVAALQPDRVLMMPDGDFANWNAEFADLIALS
ncbi:MAG TPA: ABC-F family ATP-binding cassette domain-containing protein [Acidimicrobiales bacterium]|nr:ABC-F family ATP-binding cassette domain-containing protein [Acidimicrobiales bacterium]